MGIGAGLYMYDVS